MISAAAITLALAFWAPYNHGQPVCPDGVDVHYVRAYGFADGEVPGAAYVRREDGQVIPNCNVYMTAEFVRQPVAFQCAFVARALGTSVFGLSPSSDRRNIMYGPAWVTPAACHPVRSRRQG